MNNHLSDTRFILFLAPYPKGSATALHEGAFVVYLNLKKATRHPVPDEYPLHVIFFERVILPVACEQRQHFRGMNWRRRPAHTEKM